MLSFSTIHWLRSSEPQIVADSISYWTMIRVAFYLSFSNLNIRSSSFGTNWRIEYLELEFDLLENALLDSEQNCLELRLLI